MFKKKRPYITKNKINLLDKLKKEIDSIKEKEIKEVEVDLKKESKEKS